MQRTTVFRKINLLLIIAILVMVNLVAGNWFFAWDLTGTDAYSLSRISRETLTRLEDPLRVQVFYTQELPAPYNGVRRYLLDMLREYDAAEQQFFSWEEIDVTTPEGRTQAQQNGLQQVEIQEIRSDEFQSRAVFMGVVVSYGNVVETVDRIANTESLEYRLTTAISSVVTRVDALAGSDEAVVMEVIASPALSELQIQGFRELEAQMAAIHERVNRDNYNRITYEFLRPDTPGEIAELSERYGVQPVRWQSQSGEERAALLEIVLHRGEQIERIPIEIFTQLFGGYILDDPANLEEAVRQGLRSLVAANERVAYALGHGEKALQDYQQGAGPFTELAGQRYELQPVFLAEEDIPSGIDTLIINGPTQSFSRSALYRLDQFLMAGGSLLLFLDSHSQVVPSQQQQMMGLQVGWEENLTGLAPLLERYGVRHTAEFVLDEESYIIRQPQGSTPLYQVPLLNGESLNRENVITAGLEDILVMYATELLPVDAEAGETSIDEAVDARGARYIPLLSTSDRSWTVSSPEEIGPWLQGAPASADQGPRDVAVLLEGTFLSYFEEPVELGIPAAGTDVSPTGTTPTPAAGVNQFALRTERFLPRSVEQGRLLVFSGSAVTTAQMLDPRSPTPNGMLLLNALDYLNGVPEMASLRSKGLGVPRITVNNPTALIVARWGNTILVPGIVVLIGVVVWSRRRARSQRIKAIFAQKEDGL